MSQPNSLPNILVATIDEVFERISVMGKVMLMQSAAGITFERIGLVDTIMHSDQGPSIFLGPPTDDSPKPMLGCLESAAVASLQVDRSNLMKDKIYPRLILRDANQRALLTVIGFDGLEPFDKALSGFLETPCEAEVEGAPSLTPALASSQRVKDALSTVAGEDIPVSLSFGPGTASLSREHGAISALKNAMGFVNIIEPDFHLHVKEGAIGWWQEEDLLAMKENNASESPSEPLRALQRDSVRLVACTPEGWLTGLAMTAPRSVFRSELWQLG